MEPHLLPERNDAPPTRAAHFALQCAAMRPRLPFADELPPSGPRRWGVLAMLVAGGAHGRAPAAAGARQKSLRTRPQMPSGMYRITSIMKRP